MTRTFSDIDDIGGTPHLVENRFRLNGAAAIFEIIHTQEFPIRQFEGKQKNSYFAYVVISIPVKCCARAQPLRLRYLTLKLRPCARSCGRYAGTPVKRPPTSAKRAPRPCG
jgi:hypothetical protein